jgi:DNA repair protein RadC
METITCIEAWTKVAEIEIVYRTKVKASERPKISQALDAYQIFQHSWDKDKIELIEQFKILLLNRAKKVIGICEVSTGGITGTIADLRIIIGTALKAAACELILCHNHPSGNLRPSAEDTLLTKRIKECALLFDITVLDHLIISSEGFYSFAGEGEL